MSEGHSSRYGDQHDHLVQWLHGMGERVRDEQNPLEFAGLTVDLQDRACPQCREVWLPWQRECPRDGSATIPASELPSLELPPEELL